MKERKARNRKIMGVINVIVIVYIFTLVIGYSFFRETLKISGNVSTEKPKECPFELQEIVKIYSGEDELSQRYFAEYQDYKTLDDNNSGNALVSAALNFNTYDINTNVYSLIVNNNFLFSNDATTGAIEYKTFTKPIYLVFKNTTSYPLDSFILQGDPDNYNGSYYPIDGIDIRWLKISDINEIYEVIKTDFENDNAVWKNLSSVFDESGFSSLDVNGEPAYPFDYLMDQSIEFKTDTIKNGEYLVLGIKFPKTSEATWSNRDRYDLVVRDSDGISFTFYPSNFKEEASFKARIAFVSWDDISYILMNQNDFFYLTKYDYPSNYKFYGLDWWKTDY